MKCVRHSLRDDVGKVRRSALREERIGWVAKGISFREAFGT